MRLLFVLSLLFSCAVWTSALPYGGTKGYQPPSQYEQSRGDKLIEDGGFDQSEGTEFVAPNENQDGGILVGPYDYEFMDTVGPDGKGKGSLTSVAVEEHPGLEGEIFPTGEDSFNTDFGQTDLGQEHPATAQEENGQGGVNSWLDTLAEKWNFVKDKTKATADSLQDSVQAVYESVQSALPALWQNFKGILVNSGKMIHRGAEYVVQKVSIRFEKAKASEVIQKLQHRLEQGEEIVADFFRHVGEKATSWMEKHDNADIDSGLLQETQEFGAHFADPTFPDLFQDKEIQVQVNRLVHAGVLTQIEADHLFQNKQQEVPNEEIFTAPSDSGIQVALDNSAGNKPGSTILFKDDKFHHGTNNGNESPVQVQPKPSILLEEESLPVSEHIESTYGNEYPVEAQPEPSILLKEESFSGSEHPGSTYGNEAPVEAQPEPSILLKEDNSPGSEHPGSTYGNESPVDVQPEPSILLKEESFPGSEHPGSTYGNEAPVEAQPEPSILLKEESLLGSEHLGSTYGNEYPAQVQPKPSILLEEILPDNEHIGSTYENESPIEAQPEPSILLKEESSPGSEHPESTYGNEYPVQVQPKPSILLEETLPGSEHIGSIYGNEFPVVEEPPVSVLIREETPQPGQSYGMDSTSVQGNEASVVDLQGSSDYEPQGGGVTTHGENFDPHHTVKKDLLGPEQIDQQQQYGHDQVKSTYPDSSVNQIQNGMNSIFFPNNW